MKARHLMWFMLALATVFMLASCDPDDPDLTEDKWTVTFSTGDGTAITPLDVDKNASLTRPEDPVRQGYLFSGWYKDEQFVLPWNFEYDSVTGDMTLFAKWKEETDFTQSFKVLSIGNSFSEDAHRYLWSIAEAAGIPDENIVIANMYIGGAALYQHVTNIQQDNGAYTYQKYTSSAKSDTYGAKLSEAIVDEEWDVVTFQQVSTYSGVASSYADSVIRLTRFVEDNALNPYVQLFWHMTWAYQQTSTHSGFVNYDSDQMTMYEGILDAVGKKIDTISQINGVIPSGTAIQNARTSYIGDNLTRDGYHLSDPMGRYIAGLTFFRSLTGTDLAVTAAYRPSGVSETMQSLAIEAVNNAYAVPRAVTASTFTTEPEPEIIDVNGVEYTFEYAQGFWGDGATAVSPASDALHNSFAAVMPIPKHMLPVGSEITIAEGYQYRVIYFEKVGEGFRVVSRSALFQIPYIEIDESFWGSYDYVGFNIASNPYSDISSRLDEVAGKLTLYHPEGTGTGHIDGDLSFASGLWEMGGSAMVASANHQASEPLTLGYFNGDTEIEVASGYKLAYVLLTYDAGAYEVLSVSDYQTEPLYIDPVFSEGKELIAFIITTTDEDIDISAVDMDAVVDAHPKEVPHHDSTMAFISGYWESGKTAITTTNENMDFLNGFAASQPQSKHWYNDVSSVTVAEGFQVRVVYLSYDGYGTYTVLLRTNWLTGTIQMDETFWGEYGYIAFNIASVPSSNLSGVLDTLPGQFSFESAPLSFELGYWNTNGTSLSGSTSYAGSNVIHRQFMPAGTVVTVAEGYQLRVNFMSYDPETDLYKVMYRTENFTGTFILSDGFWQHYQYVSFNISTTPTSDLTPILTDLPLQLGFASYDGVVLDHVDEPLSFVSGYWNNFAIAVTTGDTSFIKGFAASNVLSKSSLQDVTEIVVAEGYQVRVIYLDHSYNQYSVMFRTNNLTGTIVLDDLFWGDYQFVAFNISSVPSSDLSGVLETLPALMTFVTETE